ncbi:MAG: hypothetical protein ACR2P8_07100 [Myxococcota bacterium]
METALFLALLAAATALLAARRDGAGLGLAGLVAGLAVLGGWLWQPGGDPVLDGSVPAKRDDGGFATSDRCRACHPGAYAAWHGSFHRTMTQRAIPASVLGNFDGVALTSRGHRTRLERRGDEFWADLPDPLWLVEPSPNKPATPPRIRVRVVMTTGSHHLQNYWIRRPSSGDLYRDVPDNGALVQLPWVWDVADARWLPVQDSFLAPPSDTTQPPEVWNSSCHACHSVGTQPRLTGEAFATRSAELGIACEACHGPAAEHVEANGSPWRRYLQHFSKGGGPTIVNPSHLEAPRAAEVCGQCHSFSHERNPQRIRQTGPAFRPGEVLAETRAIFRYDEHPRPAVLEEYLARDPGVLESAFWADGTMRVAGREYNGLIESACYQRGELTCISCHSMHGYAEPSDQLKAGQDDDAACIECHRGIATRVAEHSHHAPDSSGSRCVNCHMPHTSFGLFGAMRSHRVDSPSAARSAETGRPNACNLCHLDRTLGWAAGYLSDWYGQPPATLDPRQRELAAGPLWAVRGDAAQRAIAAWHMGWAPAQQASGRKWMGAYLAVLLADPYPVVRRVAERALASHQGFEGFAFDFVAAPDELTRKLTAAAGRWSRAMAGRPDRSGPELLLDPRGELDEPALRSLLAERDNTPVRIVE